MIGERSDQMDFGFVKKIICAGIAGSLLLCGCGSEIANLTDEQQQQVGEYAAFTMLRYDADHRSRLVDYSEVEAADESARIAEEARLAAEEAKKEETETPDNKDNDQNVIDKTSDIPEENYQSDTMEDFLDLTPGMLLSYKGYTIQGSYPEDNDISEYFVVEAGAGKKFLVLWYTLYNGSGTSQEVNFLSDNIAFKSKVNGEINATALVTMLNDDMSTLQTSLSDNEEIDCVLIYEIDESAADNLESIIVKLSKSGANWERQVL